MMNKDTKFYRVTEAIVKNYEVYKEMKPAQIAKELDIPSGVASHIMRTIYIVKGEV